MPTTGETATTPSSAEVARAKERARELQQATYPAAHAVERECDLVMKGGITSGVVYPLAACELARTYRFKSIGGSSAGAIAASLVAAAEYGRDRGGFNRLAALPEQIGPTLPKLFTPGPRTRTAHAALMAWLEPGATTLTKVRRVVSKLLTSQPKWFWGGTGAAVVVALLAGQLLAGVPDDAVSALRFVVIAAFMALLGSPSGRRPTRPCREWRRRDSASASDRAATTRGRRPPTTLVRSPTGWLNRSKRSPASIGRCSCRTCANGGSTSK
jgi:hypothetical protein